MKDRIPGAPGQYKAVVTEADLQKMQAGEEFAITMTRDDHPIEEGTPYSKAAVLPDALALSICPNVEDPTPADALEALHAKAVESSDHPGCYYRMVAGEMEWINPPVLFQKEYRTTERFMGRPVYTKLLYAKLDSSTVQIEATGYAAVKWHGFTTLGDSLPTENANAAWAISVQLSGSFIIFRSGNSVVENAPEAYIQVWYTK